VITDRLCNVAFTATITIVLLASCTATQRRDTRTALQAVDAVCDALEVVQVDQAVTIACELTDDAREAAIKMLKPKRKPKRPHPATSASAAPAVAP
jgi:hypothetical protein